MIRDAAGRRLLDGEAQSHLCANPKTGILERLDNLRCAFLVILTLALAGSPSVTAASERGHRDRCKGILEEIVITADDQTQTVVTLDDIVPKSLQGMIETDREALTGVWISDLDLWTNVNAAACEVPKVAACPDGALEGACPAAPPEQNMFSCNSPSTWVNNTFAIYELTTGSLYALNLWRVWSQQEYPTVAALRAAKPPVLYGGFSFENGLRNLDDRISLSTSLGEFDTIGSGTGASIILANLISMEGRVYDSNVGTVIISESKTETAVSLVYGPENPKQALWRINLRRVPGCVSSEAFEEQIFPPRKKIRIEDD